MKNIAFLFFVCSIAFGCQMVFAQSYVLDEEGYVAERNEPRQQHSVSDTSFIEAPLYKDRASLYDEKAIKRANKELLKRQRLEEWEKRRHNITASAGFLPFTVALNIFDEKNDANKGSDLWAYTLTYGYEFAYHFETGFMLSLSTYSNGHPVGSFVPRIKANFVNTQNFRLYEYIGLGIMFWDSGYFFTFNVSLIGLEFGVAGPLSIFSEVGWGSVGMLTIGAKLAF